MNRYLLIVWEDNRPALRGPYPADKNRVKAAARFRSAYPDDHGLYRLDVKLTAKGNVVAHVDTFSGRETHPEEE